MTLVSLAPFHTETGWDPNAPMTWVVDNDYVGLNFDGLVRVELADGGHTEIVTDSVPITGWDFTATLSMSNQRITCTLIPTGGWPANTLHDGTGPNYTIFRAIHWTDGGPSFYEEDPLNQPEFTTGDGSSITADATTLSPLAVGMGSIAYASAAADTVSIQNFVASTRGMVHWNFGATTVNSVERPPIDGHFPNSITGYREWFSFRIWLDPDVQTLTFGVRAYFSTATHAGNVQLTIGSTTATINRTQAQNGTEGTASITAAAVASTGWVDCAVTYERTVGTSGDAYVRNIRLQDDVIAAADLPPPEND